MQFFGPKTPEKQSSVFTDVVKKHAVPYKVPYGRGKRGTKRLGHMYIDLLAPHQYVWVSIISWTSLSIIPATTGHLLKNSFVHANLLYVEELDALASHQR